MQNWRILVPKKKGYYGDAMPSGKDYYRPMDSYGMDYGKSKSRKKGNSKDKHGY